MPTATPGAGTCCCAPIRNQQLHTPARLEPAQGSLFISTRTLKPARPAASRVNCGAARRRGIASLKSQRGQVEQPQKSTTSSCCGLLGGPPPAEGTVRETCASGAPHPCCAALNTPGHLRRGVPACPERGTRAPPKSGTAQLQARGWCLSARRSTRYSGPDSLRRR